MNELYRLFRINDQPLILSHGQELIFNAIIDLIHPRVQIICPTQYGKSLTVSLAVLCSAVGMGDRWTILAPSEKKALIIMRYVIDHIFDDAIFTNALELDATTSLDRLRRERSRTNITFKGGGGIQVLTLDARNSKRSIESAIGFGGNRVILDESSLVDDRLYSTVKRMLGGYAYADTFLLEIGNPFYRNHYLRTWNSNRYHKIYIDYIQGLKEGRYSPEFIDEMRDEAFFDVLYECRFPEADSIDARGYRNLLSDESLQKCWGAEKKTGEDLKLGIDVGGGGDYNVFCIRSKAFAWIESRNQSNDTMANVTETEEIMNRYGIKASNVFIDDIGIGRGVSDRLKEKGIKVNGIAVGEKAQDSSRFKNIKAEINWSMKKWLESGGKIEKNDGFLQLLWIKYKVSTDRMIQIEAKQEMVQRTGKSPDYADSLALTFSPSPPTPSIRFL
jgi:hypothetical protein